MLMQKLMERIREEVKITSTIKRLVAQRIDVILWQYDDLNKRVLKNAQILKADEYNDEIFFTPKKNTFSLDLEKYLYCLYKDRAMVFKGKISFCSKYKLALKFPKQILIEESRSETRCEPKNGKEHLNFNFGQLRHKEANYFPYSTILNDYSVDGLSFITNVANITKFEIGNFMTFKLGYENNKIMEGKVIHISKTTQSNLQDSYQQHQYKVGIQLFD
jgi:hypothetical protein